MKNSNIKIGSNKILGIVFFIFFFIVSVFPLFKDGNIRVWSLIVAIIFLILGLLKFKTLTPLNKIYFKFVTLLGNLISQIVMSVVFFGIITPISIIIKIFGKNLLNLKRKNKETYWIEKSKITTKMKNQS